MPHLDLKQKTTGHCYEKTSNFEHLAQPILFAKALDFWIG